MSRRAIAISLGLHAALLAVMAGRDEPSVAPPVARRVEMRIVDPPPPPVARVAPRVGESGPSRAPKRSRSAQVVGPSAPPAPIVSGEVLARDPDEGRVTREVELDLAPRTLPPGLSIEAPAAAIVEAPSLEPTGDGTWRFEDHGFTAYVARDGSVHFEDELPVAFGGGAPLTFDLTDAVMRANGDDPYRHEKAKFMRQTEAFRAKLCSADRTDKLRRSVLALPRDLERVWADPSASVELRRRRLFELWDQCASDLNDPEQAKLGEMARATVMGFIRRTLPAGSAEAYPREELAALNAVRVSTRAFSPY